MKYRLLQYTTVLSGMLACWPQAWAEQAGSTAKGLREPAVVLGRTTGTADMGSQMLQLLLGLLLVIGLIFLLAWLTRRVQQRLPGGHGSDTIQLVATRSLSPRERLLLVQVGKEQVLLGLTPGSIETLHVLQEPVEAAIQDTQTVGEFARRLKQALHQGGPDKDKET